MLRWSGNQPRGEAKNGGKKGATNNYLRSSNLFIDTNVALDVTTINIAFYS